MKTITKIISYSSCLSLLLSYPFASALAEDKPEVTVSADLVSNYIWRGQDLGGISVQPTFGISYRGFSFTSWGSIGFDRTDPKEIDLTLDYQTGGFNIGITDYWVEGTRSYFHYDTHNTGHVFEGNIGYDFGPVALSWYTNFAGADYYRDEETKRAFSSYFEISAPFTFAGFDWRAEIGATPWEGAYASGFAIVNVALGASRTLEITDRFSIPLFAKAIANPSTEAFYLVFGVTF